MNLIAISHPTPSYRRPALLDSRTAPGSSGRICSSPYPPDTLLPALAAWDAVGPGPRVPTRDRAPPPQGTAGSDTLLPSPVGWGPRRAGTCEIPSVHLGSFPRRGGSGPTPFYQRSPHPVSGDGAGPRDVPSVIRLAARMGPSPTPFYQLSHNDTTGRADISLELAGFGHSDFHHLARPPSPTPFYRPPSDGGTSARFLGV